MRAKTLEQAAKLLCSLLLLVLTFTYILGLNYENMPLSQGITLIVLYLIFIISSLNLYKAVANGLLFNGLAWRFWLVFLCIAPMVQIKTNRFPLSSDSTPENNQLGVLIILVATVFLWLGNITYHQPKEVKKVNASNSANSQKYISLLAFVSLVCFFVISIRSSFGVFLLTRYEYENATRYALFSPQITLIVVSLCKIASIVCASYFILNRERDSFKGIGGCFKIFIILEAIYVNNPISSSRLGFVAMLTVLVLSWGKIHPNLIRFITLSIVPFYLFLFPFLDRFRYEKILTKKSGVYESLINPDFDAYQQLSNTVAFVHAQGFQMGKQFAGAILLFVPNEFWQSKPIPSGPLVATSANLRFTNVSSPIPAEAFIDFGIAGVIAYTMLIGYLISRADRVLLASQKRGSFSSISLVLLLAISGQISLLLRGALIGVAGPSILVFLFFASFKFKTYLESSRI